MATLRLGIIGLGAIGRPLVQYVRNGLAGQTEIVAALVRDPGRHQDLGLPLVTNDFQVFISAAPEVVVEAAGHEALRRYAVPVLQSGCDLILVAAGAFADDDLLSQVMETARAHGRRVQIASGAIGGLDAIGAAAVGGLDEVVHTTRKPPAALLPPDEAEAVMRSGQERELFRGPAREAAVLFPESVNVAAAVSLAGLGLDRTVVRVVADPAVQRNTHQVDVRGYFGTLRFQIQNIPSETNPRTGRLVAMSVARALAIRTAPLVVG